MNPQESFLALLDESFHTGDRIILAMPDELARVLPGGRFGPADLILHLTQSERFGQGILEAATRGNPFELPPVFNQLLSLSGEERHRALSRLNLDGARTKAEGYARKNEPATELLGMWQTHTLRLHDWTREIEPRWFVSGEVVSHPLVTLELPWPAMAYTLLIAHRYYHLGQLTAWFKQMGYGHLLPLPFGTT